MSGNLLNAPRKFFKNIWFHLLRKYRANITSIWTLQKTVTTLIMLYKIRKQWFDNNDIFNIVAGGFQGDILAPCLSIICLYHVLGTSIYIKNEMVSHLKKTRSRWYQTIRMIDEDYADYLMLLANTLPESESLLHKFKQSV